MQGAVSDKMGAHRSYFIPFIGFFLTALYGYAMIIYERRMAKKVADAAISAPVVASSLDRADSTDEKYVEEDKIETTHIA